MTDVGSKMKVAREQRGYSQTEVANKMNISRSYYSRWEKNEKRINAEQLIQFAKIVGVTLDFFSDDPAEKTLFETMAELSSFFTSEGISENDKDKAYQDIMRIYLNSKELLRSEHESNDKTNTINRENAERKCEQ